MEVQAACTACGQANPVGAKFCNECGAAMAYLVGHAVRKTLTVLFADLVGFTGLGERVDGESLRRVMDRFYEEMSGAVHAHGGTVAKFIGDAVMAVWGTPVAREDDAVRAVRAAEEMRGALRALNADLEQRWGVRVGMRTGVNTGEVVVDSAKAADLLVGDTLNVAARLEQAAADGEVLIGAETYRLVRDNAMFEPVEPLQLKGKSRRLPAYRLVDGARPPPPRADRLRAPLVGRDGELARLRAAFDAAVAAGETRLVTVVGSPGVGKSRLAAELAARLEGEARILRGHCEPSTEGATFLPVAEVLRAAAGIEEGGPVRERLAAAAPDEDEPHVADALAAVLGEGVGVTAEETFWAVRRFLERLARDRPVVVVLDDVHWGEPTFLDLVEHLAKWGRDGPLLVVALARPELREWRPALAEVGAVAHDTLALEALAREASRALVDGLLGAADLPAELAERVLETADGNPLFLGEMIRMLIDDGVLRREGDTWVVAAEQVSVPPTIQALLAVRLEGLPQAERIVAERAAVIGPTFSRASVAALAGAGLGAAIDEHLDALRRKELIVAVDRSAEDPVYRFGHALIRDAAYRRLLKESRADLHERFAVSLEARGGGQDEIVGFHLERAYGYRLELGPLGDDGRDLGRRAGARLCEAGRRALGREDLPAAANLLGRALNVLEDADPMRSEVLLDLAESLLSAGDTARGGEVVEELALRADAVGDERLRAYATAFGGQLANLVSAGGVRETIALVAEAAGALAAAGDAAGEAKAHHVIAAAHALLGEVASAEAALDRALVAARAAGDGRRVTAALSGAPRAALWGPSPVVRASGRCLDIVRIVRMTPGNRHVETMALRCQAVLEAMRGRPAAGRKILRDGRAALEELGLTFELHELDMYAGTIELLADEPAAADERLRAARDGFLALGVDTAAAQAAALLARAVLEQDRDDEAIALTEFAQQRGGEDLKTAIAWRGVRAEALARRGRHDDAARLAREAVALSDPTDALADKADALMALVAVLHAVGDEDGARAAAIRARDLYAAKEHTVGLRRASAAAGEPPPAHERRVSGAAGLGDAPSEQVANEWLRRINARDFDGVLELYTQDFRIVDHRPVGADMAAAGDLVASLSDIVELVPDYEWRIAKVLGTAEYGIASVLELVADSLLGGGPMELALGVVTAVRDGHIAAAELFEPDDEDGILARFEQLAADSDPVRLAPGVPADHSVIGYLRAQCAAFEDHDAWAALLAPDYVAIDRRLVGWGERLDRDFVLETRATTVQMTPDMRETMDVIAVGEDLVARIISFSGHTEEGGGRIDLAFAVVTAFENGLYAYEEYMPLDDHAAVLARFDELLVERAATAATRIAAELARRYHARDWDGLRALYSDNWVHEDRRAVALWDVNGPDDVVAQLRDMARLVPDIRLRLDVLADAGDVAAWRVTFAATYDGSPIENRVLQTCVIRDGRLSRVEEFDPDDEQAVVDRFNELRRGVRAAPGVGAAHPN